MFNWLKRLLLAIEKLAENSEAESEYVRKLYEKQTQMEFEAIVFRRDIADLIVETKQLSGRLTILNTELEAHKAKKRHSHGKKENITPPANGQTVEVPSKEFADIVTPSGRELIADSKLYQTAKAAIEDKTGASRYQVEGKDAGPETPMQAMGKYSCASCGMFMREPCVHWAAAEAKAAEIDAKCDELASKWQPGDVPPGTVTAGRITLAEADSQADGCK